MRLLEAFLRLLIDILCILARFIVNVLQDCITWLDKRHALVAALSTVVIALLTYEYATYSRDQWQVMQDTLDSDRPWVDLNAIDISNSPPESGQIDATVMVANGGRSPAVTANFYGDIVASDSTAFKRIQDTCRGKPVAPFTGIMILPGTTKTFHKSSERLSSASIKFFGLGLSNPAALRNIPGHKDYYLVGCVDYRGDRNRCFRTRFCRAYVSNSGVGFSYGYFAYCVGGNSQDKGPCQ